MHPLPWPVLISPTLDQPDRPHTALALNTDSSRQLYLLHEIEGVVRASGEKVNPRHD